MAYILACDSVTLGVRPFICQLDHSFIMLKGNLVHFLCISQYFPSFVDYIVSFLLTFLWYFSCQSQAAAVYFILYSFLFLTAWLVSAPHCMKKDGSFTSENLRPTQPCHPGVHGGLLHEKWFSSSTVLQFLVTTFSP